ncbi:MAG: hypothetical protein AMS16_06915 [Planctomycetes bacterium DG_58]|nr:MAG: hypothetical protein AMS16_06915 [Planctomycetes bacterium DG_58]
MPAPAPVKRCGRPPRIDGSLADPCWNTAELRGLWMDVYTGDASKLDTKAYVCYDDRNLYVAFHNPEPNMAGIVTDAGKRDGTVWEDDSNELFIDPTAGKKDYYQFMVNAKGVLYDGRGKDSSWDGKAKVAVKKMADGWSVEIAIPLSDLGVTASPGGQTWTANFCRNRQAEGEAEAYAWADTGESFHNPEAFGKLKFE